MKQYQSFEDIETELRHLDLERKIAWEEMKLLKNEFQEDLRPTNWIQFALKTAGKYGLFLITKRLLR